MVTVYIISTKNNSLYWDRDLEYVVPELQHATLFETEGEANKELIRIKSDIELWPEDFDETKPEDWKYFPAELTIRRD